MDKNYYQTRVEVALLGYYALVLCVATGDQIIKTTHASLRQHRTGHHILRARQGSGGQRGEVRWTKIRLDKIFGRGRMLGHNCSE